LFFNWSISISLQRGRYLISTAANDMRRGRVRATANMSLCQLQLRLELIKCLRMKSII